MRDGAATSVCAFALVLQVASREHSGRHCVDVRQRCTAQTRWHLPHLCKVPCAAVHSETWMLLHDSIGRSKGASLLLAGMAAW